MLHHIVGKIAGSILAATILHGMTYKVEVVLLIYIERWNCPMAFGVFGLLFHIEHLVVLVQHDNTCALQFLYGWLVVADDARCAFCLGILHKVTEREEQQVVGCYNKEVIVYLQFVHGKEEVANSTESGVVGLCAIIDDSDGFGIGLLVFPLVEDVGKLVVGDDDVLVDVGNGIDVIKHTSQDSIVAYLKQRFGKVLCQFAKASGVTCCYYDILHCGLISTEYVSCIYFILTITEALVEAVGDDGICLSLELGEVVNNEAAEEGAAVFNGWLIDDNVGSLGLDALHDALYGRLAEVVGVGLHGQAIETDGD